MHTQVKKTALEIEHLEQDTGFKLQGHGYALFRNLLPCTLPCPLHLQEKKIALEIEHLEQDTGFNQWSRWLCTL